VVATMAEVALRAGVSVTTVSHVVNKTRKVAPATQELVLRAMASTGYRHNLAARALATQSTDTIGLAMSIVTNPYFADLVRGIERQLRAAGFTLVIADTNDDGTVQMDVLEHLMGRRVSGLIVSPLEGDPALDDMLQSLLEEGFPLLMVDRRSNLPCDQVYSESTDAVASITAHLAEHGHTRIAYVTGSLSSMSARDRLAGYHQAVRHLALDDDPSLVLDGQSDEARAEEQVASHLDGPDPASAIVVGNNQMTLGTLRAVQRRQLRIPQDLAIVCYDDFEWADLFSPRLTAVAQNAAVLASSAVDLLLARIQDPDRPIERVVVPTAFRHRDSCGC
jgi:LacI family transcriptional regulator